MRNPVVRGEFESRQFPAQSLVNICRRSDDQVRGIGGNFARTYARHMHERAGLLAGYHGELVPVGERDPERVKTRAQVCARSRHPHAHSAWGGYSCR